MGKFKLLVAMAVTLGLTVGLSGMAFAASQGGCGWCHGVMQNISSYSNAGVSTNVLRDMRGVTASPTESSLLPQGDNDRGLHGIHMNYSSYSYKGGGSVNKIINVAKTGGTKSAFAVNPTGATTRIVGPTAFGNYSAYVLARGNCGYCHASKHPNHESGFLEWSSTVVAGNYGQITRGFIRYSSNQGGVSHQVNGQANHNTISSLNSATRTGSCTAACHKGTSMTNRAPWGSYTTAAIKLTCNSCHADSSGVSGTEAALSGMHAAHMASNATTPSGVLMGASANAGCVNCHPNNTAEGKTTKDWGPGWGSKAYPHASDGTNVVSDNVTFNATYITSATKSGLNTTCANACHPRSNLISTSTVNWSVPGTIDCNMCHYYETTPSVAGNDAITTGNLPGAHDIHIGQSIACATCHPIPADVAHHAATSLTLPVSSTGVGFVAGINYTGGAAGTCQNSCHTTTSGLWSTTIVTQGCSACHEYPNSTNTWSLSQGANGHTVKPNQTSSVTLQLGQAGYLKHLVNWSSYSKTTDTYAGVTADTAKCGRCHSAGTHMNGTVDVNAPATGPSAGFTVIRNQQGAGSVQCSNTKCHFSRTTPNWN